MNATFIIKTYGPAKTKVVYFWTLLEN